MNIVECRKLESSQTRLSSADFSRWNNKSIQQVSEISNSIRSVLWEKSHRGWRWQKSCVKFIKWNLEFHFLFHSARYATKHNTTLLFVSIHNSNKIFIDFDDDDDDVLRWIASEKFRIFRKCFNMIKIAQRDSTRLHMKWNLVHIWKNYFLRFKQQKLGSLSLARHIKWSCKREAYHGTQYLITLNTMTREWKTIRYVRGWKWIFSRFLRSLLVTLSIFRIFSSFAWMCRTTFALAFGTHTRTRSRHFK